MIRHHQVQVGDSSIHVMLLAESPGETTTAASRLLAVDLPGIGASTRGTAGASKTAIAGVLRGAIEALQPEDLTLVGHDIGGMVVYAYLRQFADLPRAVIMDVPVPGVEPWDEFVRAPFLWHFALHAVPRLPEILTTGKQAEYLGYFYDLLSAHPGVPGRNRGPSRPRPTTAPAP